MPKYKNQRRKEMMKLIVFEGLDGSGVTSLIHALQPQLKTPHQLYQGLVSSSLGKGIRNLFLNFQQVDESHSFLFKSG
ncbi:hypothetical protein [Paulownia witches'-broom phytoplasma]|uniref:hypothetical protein n=1 Tax=Paulownia witches'-broom phytoplasma TaxID=39647 RepID=UPI001CED0514|nr:hypothetical protein [Paulownia witches'-broom phytoplasma]